MRPLTALWASALRSPDSDAACFLRGELASRRFGAALREQLAASGHHKTLVTRPDLADEAANTARRRLLGATRGYERNQDLFENFPVQVKWMRALLEPHELAAVRYIDYSYWVQLSGGSRRPLDAARRIRAGEEAFGVPNAPLAAAARAVERGVQFEPLIVVGVTPKELVCLEGHLRLTAYALAGFPRPCECLVGLADDMAAWAH